MFLLDRFRRKAGTKPKAIPFKVFFYFWGRISKLFFFSIHQGLCICSDRKKMRTIFLLLLVLVVLVVATDPVSSDELGKLVTAHESIVKENQSTKISAIVEEMKQGVRDAAAQGHRKYSSCVDVALMKLPNQDECPAILKTICDWTFGFLFVSQNCDFFCNTISEMLVDENILVDKINTEFIQIQKTSWTRIVGDVKRLTYIFQW